MLCVHPVIPGFDARIPPPEQDHDYLISCRELMRVDIYSSSICCFCYFVWYISWLSGTLFSCTRLHIFETSAAGILIALPPRTWGDLEVKIIPAPGILEHQYWYSLLMAAFCAKSSLLICRTAREPVIMFLWNRIFSRSFCWRSSSFCCCANWQEIPTTVSTGLVA